MSDSHLSTECVFVAMRDASPNLSQKPSLAILCPVYNEEKIIPLFFDRIRSVFARLNGRYRTQLYFIDNGSTDQSLDAIRLLHEQFPDVYAIVLSRNFGYECALETGLRTAEADLYAMIDVDCEDPPEMILDFVKYREEGYDIVYGERVDRPENMIVKGLRKVFYRMVRRVADDNFVLDMAEFSLITAEVRDAIIQDATSFPFLRASIGRIGFHRKNIPYRRHARVAGQTHYSFIGMVFFAVSGILSSSTLALRVPAYLFPFWVAVLGALVLWACLAPAPWHVPVLLLIGFCYLGFAVVSTGLYVARTYKNSLQRPNAIIRYHFSILPPAIADRKRIVEKP